MFTRTTSLALRLLADASPSHFFTSLIWQRNSSFSIFNPTSSSLSFVFDHCVASFSIQCQLFGFVARNERRTRENRIEVPLLAYHPDGLLQSSEDHLCPTQPSILLYQRQATRLFVHSISRAVNQRLLFSLSRPCVSTILYRHLLRNVNESLSKSSADV